MNILVLITSSHHFSYSYLILSEIFKSHLFKDLIKMNNVKGMLAVIHWLFHRSQIPERCINSIFNMPYTQGRSFQVVVVVKNLPANVRDIEKRFDPWVQKIPLEEGTVTHSGILAWRIPWPEEPGGLQSMGSQRVGHD